MDKQRFLDELRRRLRDLPESEAEKSIEFYSESIDDRVEDGMTEEEAVAALGSLDEIVQSIKEAQPLSTIVKARLRSDRERKGGTGAGWIVLAIVGSPVWLPLLIAALAVVLSVYISLWAVVISVAAAALALVVAGIAALLYGIFRAVTSGLGALLLALGAAGVCVGLGLVLVWAVVALGKGAVKAGAAFGRWIKRLAIGKGGTQE